MLNKTEYSLKSWVYRFKISKSEENLKMLGVLNGL